MNVTDRMIQATQKENEIISVLQAIQPFKITDDFVAFSDQLVCFFSEQIFVSYFYNFFVVQQRIERLCYFRC